MLLISCFPALTVFSQTFKGTVTDQETNEPIPYANVYFVELETGTTTDENGIFTIEHYPKKGIHIQISFIGYKTTNEVIDLAVVSEREFFIEPSHVGLEEVVISVPTGKLQGENVVSIEQRKLEQLQQTAPLTLAEAISNIAGVEQNTTGAGIGKPIIRGLSGNRIVTYAQGIRIENQQWGDEHGLGVGDVGIESVEVIKGPASLLYGSDALGGVLYFVVERYAKHNTIEGFAQTRFLSNTLGTFNSAGAKFHKEKFKLNLFGAYSSNADYQIPNAQRVFNTRFDEKNFKTSMGYNHKHWISNLRYSFLQNNFGITDTALFTTSTERAVVLPFQSIDNHNLSFENTLFTGNSRLNLILGFTDNNRKEFEDSTGEAALGMDLQTYTYNLKWYSPAIKDKLNLIVGTQGMYQTNQNSGEEILIPDATTSDIGGFAIVNYDLNKIQLQCGIRADYRLIDTKEVITPDDNIPAITKPYSSINYSGGAVYQLEKTTFRANISSGFRAPNTSELLSNGVHEGTNRFEKGNPNLKSENATQIDFTFDYQNEHFSFSLNPFYNTIQNFIYLSPSDTVIDNAPVYEYLQSQATLFGGEIGVHYHPHGIHWLHTESNLSTVFAEDKDNNPLPLIPSTKVSSMVKAEISHKGKVKIKNAFIQHIYKFRQDRTGIFETPTVDYHLLNLGLNLEISTKNQPIEITAGIKNLLNTKYIDHLSRFKPLGIPNQGINFYVGLKLTFEKKIKKIGANKV